MLNLEIRDINFNLNYLHKSIKKIEDLLFTNIPKQLVLDFFEFNRNRIKNHNYNVKIKSINKFNALLRKLNTQHNMFF